MPAAPPAPRRIVVKIGGSLLDLPDLGARIEALLTAAGRAECVHFALLAGGGELVEVLRGWHARGRVSESQAHHLAMQALDVTALFLTQVLPLSRLCREPADVVQAWHDGLLAVIQPQPWFERTPGWFTGPPRLPQGRLPESWSVTSDTLSACVAIDLNADELLLAKSIPAPTHFDWRQLAGEGHVDERFADVAPLVRAITWHDFRAPQLPPS